MQAHAHGVAHDGWVDGPVGPRQPAPGAVFDQPQEASSEVDESASTIWVRQIRMCQGLHDLLEVISSAKQGRSGALPAQAAAWALLKLGWYGTDAYDGAFAVTSDAAELAPQLCANLAEAVRQGGVVDFAAADAALAGVSLLADGPAGIPEDAAWPLVDLEDSRVAVRSRTLCLQISAEINTAQPAIAHRHKQS